MIQESVDSEASRVVRMVGSATLTMVVSSRAMNLPASRTISECQARLLGAGGAPVDRAVDVSVIAGVPLEGGGGPALFGGYGWM
ncbi:hypothetical protein [Rathayibacter rathayi]|uniref:hypothetical protein n=1 Tax=Rathayibacter rathayi TaxID=33887 RepID=UPI0021582540|nr:hypothetical protein [Rathayibacter rathayi]